MKELAKRVEERLVPLASHPLAARLVNLERFKTY